MRIPWRHVGIVVSSTVAHAIYIGLPLSSGVLYLEWCDSFPYSSTELISWIVSMNCGLLLIFGPATSYFSEKYGIFKCYTFGALMASVAIFCAAFARKIYILLICFGLLAGIGNSLAYIPAIVVLNVWFSKHRLLANAIGTSGIAIGMFVFGFTLESLIERYGWPGCLIIYSGICLQGLLFAIFMREPPTEFYWESQSSNDNLDQSFENRRVRGKNRHVQLLQKLDFDIFLIAEIMWNFGAIIFISVLAKKAEESGHSKQDSAYLISINGFANLVGRLFAALLGYQKVISDLGILAISTLVTGIPMLLVPAVSECYFCLVSLSCVYGIAYGIQLTSLAPAVIQVASLELVVEAFGWFNFADGIGVSTGVPFAGFLYDRLQSFNYAFYAGGTSIIIGSFLMLAIGIRLRYFNSRSFHLVNNPNIQDTIKQTRIHSDMLAKKEVSNECISDDNIFIIDNT